MKGNICSSGLVNYVLEEEEIDTVMHSAAQTHVDNSFGISYSFTQNNILGTDVLLAGECEGSWDQAIYSRATDEVYGEGTEDQEAMFEDQVLEVRSKRDTGRQKEREILKDVHILSGCQFIRGSFGHVTFRDVRSNLTRLNSLISPPPHS